MASLQEAFVSGGWVMWLIFAFGFVGVGAAGRFAWRGEHQLVPFLRWLMFTTAAAGAFGFFSGMLNVLRAATRAAHGETVALGTGTGEATAGASPWVQLLLEGSYEALNNVTGALMFAVTMSLLIAVGYRRFPSANPSARAA